MVSEPERAVVAVAMGVVLLDCLGNSTGRGGALFRVAASAAPPRQGHISLAMQGVSCIVPALRGRLRLPGDAPRRRPRWTTSRPGPRETQAHKRCLPLDRKDFPMSV